MLTGCWWWTRPGSSRRRTSRRGAAAVQRCGGTGRELSGWGIPSLLSSVKGRTLLDQELYLPHVWSPDQLALGMLMRALESGVPFGWVTGDEICGSDRNLRLWLWLEGITHVMAIKGNEKLGAWTDKGLRQVRADRLASQVEESGWTRCSAGDGTKGPRDPGCTTGPPWRYGPCGSRAEVTGCWLVAALPSSGSWPITSATAGQRRHWRNWRGWLVPTHYLGDAGPRLTGRGQASRNSCRMPSGKGGCHSRDERLIPLTVHEVRRLLTRLVWTANHPAELVQSWSLWRRHHQAQARRCHHQRRLSLLNSIVLL